MDINRVIDRLDDAWDAEGFLGRVRLGNFSIEGGKEFMALLNTIKIDEHASVPKRLLSLLWYLPSFLSWQRDRVEEKGGDVNAYDHFVTEVHNTLEIVLGVP